MRTPRTFDYLNMLSVLAHHQVEFIVIGGLCGMMHGSTLTTLDVDIVPNRTEENMKRLESALSELHAYYREHLAGKVRPEAARMNTPGHHLLMTD